MDQDCFTVTYLNDLNRLLADAASLIAVQGPAAMEFRLATVMSPAPWHWLTGRMRARTIFTARRLDRPEVWTAGATLSGWGLEPDARAEEAAWEEAFHRSLPQCTLYSGLPLGQAKEEPCRSTGVLWAR